MSSLAFRPPHFSDDVAWLPAWLQPNQSPTTSSKHTNHHNQIVKELNPSTTGESKYNLCRLHLSGEDSTPTTLTPFCEKTLHFNLHLSTVETSSIVSSPFLNIEQDEKKKPSLALVDSKGKGMCYTGHDSSKKNIVSPSIENFSGCSGRHTPLSISGVENTLEGSNHTCVECDDICDAVELSVAASEALVIHKASQSESFSDALSMSAILEAALQVKRARLDGKKESSCCFRKFGDAADILSDLGDTDMEDAYNDVGLDVCVFDNVLIQESSLSRVKETPLSELPGEDKEVQCRLLDDLEIDLDNNFTTDFLEHCPTINKSDNIPAELLNDVKLQKLYVNPSVDLVSENHLQNASLDDLQTQKEGKVDMTCVDISPLEVGVKASYQFQHSRKEARFNCPSTTLHIHCSGMNEESGNASCRFRSRWLGGWTGVDAVKSNVKHRKTINYFIEETSFLSESVDIFPDQNSVIYDCHRSSNASESNRPFEDSFKAESEGAFVSQEVVKSSSYVDPLCSVVPCSISAEIGDTIQPANIYNNHQALDTFKSLPFGREFLMENSQTGSGDKNDNPGREEHNELDMDDVGLVIHRKLTSLRTYSTGPPCVSFKKNFYSGILRVGENDARVIFDSTKFQNDKATTDQPPVKSINCPAAKSMQEDEENNLLSAEQCQSVTNTSDKQVSDKQPPVKPVFGCTAATNNMDNYSDYAFGRLRQETFEKSDDNGADKQVCFKDIPASPLVLCHRTRRFKAPKLPGDAASDKQLIDQGPALEKQYDQKNSEGKCSNLHKSGIPARKRVHFSDDSKLQNLQDHERKKLRRIHTNKYRSSHAHGTRPEICDPEQGTTSQEVKECLTKCRLKGGKKLIFQGLDFLLTGFSKNKQKEIEGLLRKHGGMVLSDIPAVLPHSKRRKALKFNAEKLPVVLCTKKLQTTKFLYGCAVNAFLLRVGWAYNSIRVGSVLPPDKYLILPHQIKGKMNQIGKSICQSDSFDHIFGKTGIMLHGTHSFCNKWAKVIKCGQGRVFKSLQWLVQSIEKKKISLAVIIVEDEHRATRHLKKCASEQNITVMPATWVINSLYEGKLLPFMENNHSSNPRATSVSEVYNPQDWSQEI